MDPLTITAAGGMRARMESLDMLANNIANAETGGYKVDREFYNLYTSQEAFTADSQDPATLPVIEKNYTDFSQGVLRATSNPLDFAIQGKGFFAVNTPAGMAYTRAGSMHVSLAGTLETADGYAVQDASGKAVKLDPGLPVDAAEDGTLSQSGQKVGQLAVFDFADPGQLVKQGNTMFRPADPKVQPALATSPIQQGRLEGSNVGPAESAVRLVSVMRQFEMLQKAIHIGVDMNRKAVEEVARVNQ